MVELDNIYTEAFTNELFVPIEYKDFVLKYLSFEDEGNYILTGNYYDEQEMAETWNEKDINNSSKNMKLIIERLFKRGIE